MLLRLFQSQIADQCRFVMTSVPMINRSSEAGDHDELWIGCQMFVVGAANISKLLWGDGKSRAKVAPRRQALRDSLAVGDGSPLRNVGMRNHFEHIDQRLDEWWSKSGSHNFVDRWLGPLSIEGNVQDVDQFRSYNPAQKAIVFWGEPFDLQEVATEVDRIYPLALNEARKPHWPPESRS